MTAATPAALATLIRHGVRPELVGGDTLRLYRPDGGDVSAADEALARAHRAEIDAFLRAEAANAPVPLAAGHNGQNGHNGAGDGDSGLTGHCGPAPWDPVTPLDDAPAPPFPTEVLPDWQRAFVEALAEATQTPPDLAASMTQDAVAAAVAKKVTVRVRAGWTEPLNRYGVVALASGERKTAVHQAVIEPIEDAQRVLAAQDAKAIARRQTERNIAAKALDRAEKEAAQAEPGEREAKRLAAEAEAERLAALTVPAATCLLADDISPEKVASVLAEQGGRLAILSDEGGIFDLMAGRYAKNGAPNLDVFLKGHSGGTVSVKRVGRPDDYAPAAALTIGLAVQPAVIAGLAEHPAFRGRGLLARFAYALPASRVGRRATRPAPVPEAVRQAYRARLLDLLVLPLPDEPHVLHLSESADTALAAFEANLEPRLAEFGDLGQVADWAGKLAGLTARHAGHFHLAEHADDPEPWATPVPAETIGRAIRLSEEYLISHALAAFALMGADPAVASAKHLLRWLLGRPDPTAPFSKRDLWRATRGRFRRAADIDAPLNVLMQHGHLRRAEDPERAGAGRKPSPTYEVNPDCRGHNGRVGRDRRE